MRGLASTNKRLENSGVKLFSSVCVLFLFGDICLCIGLFLILVPDKRIQKINQYNADASAWNNTWHDEFSGLSFSVRLNASSYSLAANTTQYGSFYPYRDSCNSQQSPCLSSKALFYEVSVPLLSNDSSTLVLYSASSSLYNRTIPLIENWVLSKKTIGCEGGSQGTCTLRCNGVGGHWSTDDYSCHVTGYLASVCLRVSKPANTSQWTVDVPPFQKLAGSEVAEGCAYRDAGNLLNYVSNRRWEPLVYTARPCSHLRVAVRHAADAVIRADSITAGCSGNAVGDAHCFGTGKAEYDWAAWLAMSVGGVTVVLEIVGGVMVWCGQFSLAHLSELFALNPSIDNDVAVVDLPLEEKAPRSGEHDGFTGTARKTANVEENMSMIETDDADGLISFAPFVSTYSVDEPMRKEAHEGRFDSSYGESKYEGCEEGI